MDATIIDAPSSTKNEARVRDPEMSSTKKGNEWCFGMKAHIGVGVDSGTVHSLDTSTAKLHDSQVREGLLHGEETSVWADGGYVSTAREAAFSDPGKFCGVMRKTPKGGALHPIDEDINRIIAMARARVEHPFRVIKRQFGYLKTRYRGMPNSTFSVRQVWIAASLKLGCRPRFPVGGGLHTMSGQIHTDSEPRCLSASLSADQFVVLYSAVARLLISPSYHAGVMQ